MKLARELAKRDTGRTVYLLDEPTTGLDPQGMKEIRDLILHLSNDQKKTIFLSSHILYEVELVANRMIIINKGAKKVEGNVDELLRATDLKVTFEVSDTVKCISLINNSLWADKLRSEANNRLVFSLEPEEISRINKMFVENEILVSGIVPTRSLEEYFLSIMENPS